MNKLKQSQNKQNNNNINIHDHTIQNEQREYNAYIGGASSIGMGSNLSKKKTQKKEIRLKTRWIISDYPAHMQMQRSIPVIAQDCT
jgi:hypothetical protein